MALFDYAHDMLPAVDCAVVAGHEVLVFSERDLAHVPVALGLQVGFRHFSLVYVELAFREADGFAGQSDYAFQIHGVESVLFDDDHVSALGTGVPICEQVYEPERAIPDRGLHAGPVNHDWPDHEFEKNCGQDCEDESADQGAAGIGAHKDAQRPGCFGFVVHGG